MALAKVSEDEVLLLWRALTALRSCRRPGCAAAGKPPRSICPLHAQCPRWEGLEDYYTRIAALLSPELRRIG